jgi:non-canonical poly(A) RNA polymerase PAPD5/7
MRDHKAYILHSIRYARYPLISVQDRLSGLDVQIVLSKDSSLSRTIMQGYMEEYPYLRQLYYVVKTALEIRGLTDVYRGGIGSYPLFMMIVASIRHAPHPPNDAAGGLLNFLRFWSEFDTRNQGISIEPAYLFDKASETVIPIETKIRLEVCDRVRCFRAAANINPEIRSHPFPSVPAVSSRSRRQDQRPR